MTTWNKARYFLCIFFFLSSLYGIATLSIAMLPSVYEWGFSSNQVSEKDKPYYRAQIKNLQGYFFMHASLNNHWTSKEKRHFSDVKQVLLKLMIYTGLSMVLFFMLLKRKMRSSVFLYSLIGQLIVCILVLFSFHSSFMLMHQLLFRNLDWIDSDPSELSYQIFNDNQFYYYGVVIAGSSIIITLLLYIYSKYRD